MFCIECGKEIKRGEQYCHDCKRRLGLVNILVYNRDREFFKRINKNRPIAEILKSTVEHLIADDIKNQIYSIRSKVSADIIKGAK